MKKKKFFSIIAFLCISFIANAQQKLTSPDGNLVLTFQVNKEGRTNLRLDLQRQGGN